MWNVSEIIRLVGKTENIQRILLSRLHGSYVWIQLSLKHLRYTNADLKISLYVCVHIKTIPWKFHILNPKNSWVICPWSL